MGRFLSIAMVMSLYGAPASAAEQTFTISCNPAFQNSFDAAVALIDTDGDQAHRLFDELVNKDQYCAAFHWGLAKTTTDPEAIQSHRLNAYLAAAENVANPVEWRKLEELPH